MAPFEGFHQRIFDSCEASSKINNAREALEELRIEIIPKIKKLNPKLNGKISEAKQRSQGTVVWTDWAWLMFTMAPLGGNKSSRPGRPIGASNLTQLTINLSRERVYTGLCLRKNIDKNRLQKKLRETENEILYEEIVNSLSGRRWIISNQKEGFSSKSARFYSAEDLRGKLLDPNLYWINASFSRDENIVSEGRIAKEIINVFKELYNLYALATNTTLIVQPKPSVSPPKSLEVLIDGPSREILTDEEIIIKTLNILGNVKKGKSPSNINIQGKIDSYPVERKVLPLDLKPKYFQHASKKILIWLDSAFKEEDVIQRSYLLKEFRLILDKIAHAFNLTPDLIQIMFTSAFSDARYTNSNVILVNINRFEKNNSLEFWLFTIARELAYLRHRRLSYSHIDYMRRIIMVGLSRLNY